MPYNPLATPLNGGPNSWFDGANCQRYVYGILNLFGINCPNLRSSNLWEEAILTRIVDDPEPLDLIFFGARSNPYGAHIGLWMAPDEVLHLCREVGKPTVWSLAEFSLRPRYEVLIGYKRVTNVASDLNVSEILLDDVDGNGGMHRNSQC